MGASTLLMQADENEFLAKNITEENNLQKNLKNYVKPTNIKS